MKNIPWIVFSALVLWHCHARANGGGVCVYHPTGGDQISSICTDPTGRMWLGTDHGLTRMMDCAHSWDTWQLRPRELQESIDNLQCASDGRLWICLPSGSYLIYNPRTNLLVTDVRSELQAIGVEVGQSFLALTEGERVWISGSEKLFCLDSKLQDLQLPATEIGFHVKRIFRGRRWLYAVGRDSMAFVDPETGQVVYTEEVETPFVEKIKSASEDRDGNLWFVDGRIIRYDVAEKTWQVVSDGPVYGNVISMTNGAVAISSTHDGVFFFGTDGHLARHMTHRSFDSTSLSSNRVNYIHQMPDGTLLICYCRQGYAQCMDAQNMVFLPMRIRDLQQSGKRDDVSALWTDASGKLWIGTEGEGLYCLPSGSNSPEKVPLSPEVDKATITAVYTDRQGTQWIGTYLQGIFRRTSDGRVTHMLPGTSVSGIDEDNRGDILLACQKHGIMRVPQGSHEAEFVSDYPTWPLQVSCNMSRQAAFATSEGLCLLNTSTLQYQRLTDVREGAIPFSHKRLSSLCRDSRGLLWLVCSPGRNKLNMLDLEHDTIYKFPVLDGINVNNVMEDDNKTMWVFSEQKLVNVIAAYDNSLKSYTFSYRYYPTNLHDGELQFNPRVIAKGGDGRIYQGTNQGLVVINPNHLTAGYANRLRSTPLFAFLKINNSMVAPGHPYNGHHILSQDIAYTNRIDLHYSENNIDLGLATTNNMENEDITGICYRVKQEGTDWIEAQNDVVSLHNLQPGTYTLMVGILGEDGVMRSNPKELVIYLAPPVWASTWAYFFYALMLASVLLISVFYYNNRRRRRMALMALREEAKRQNQLNDMKLRFLTNVSHDFRTPLSLIISPIEELIDGKADPKVRKALEIVHRNAMRLQTLVNQIIDLRRIEANAETLNPTFGDIMVYLRDKCTDYSILARERNIQLQVHGVPEMINVFFDAEKMDKIISNLLGNAFKYTPDGGIIMISVSEGASEICIRVSDTGCGIPGGEKQRVFDIFYQMADSQKNKAKGGSGIGLHIVKSMVDLHGGSVDIEDNVPQGTVFVIKLPKMAAPSNGEARPALPIPAQNAEAAIPANEDKQLTIMVVEDSTDLRSYLLQSLCSEYRVVCSSNGKEALDMLVKEEVDVIISDIMMEEMDGLELCRCIRSDVRMSHIPIILLTAKTLPDDELSGLLLGADDYVTKPFHMSILKLRIKNALLRRAAMHEKFAKQVEINVSELSISSTDEQLLQKAIDIVERNMSDPNFSVETFSAEMFMHRTGLYKKLMAITGKPPVEFIRTVRMKRAYQLLKDGKVKVADAAYRVGFNSPKLFTKYFKEEFGITPSELRSEE